MTHREFVTAGGLTVYRAEEIVDAAVARRELATALDTRRGALLSSTYEYPGRYTRWDMGFVDPPLEINCRGRKMKIAPLNERGTVLIPALLGLVERLDAVHECELVGGGIDLTVHSPTHRVPEELRSRQPSVFSVVREVLGFFHVADEGHLGLYGAFGYDLVFQFEPVTLVQSREASQRDLVLYLPDELLLVDHRKGLSSRFRYEFEWQGKSTMHRSREPLRETSSSVKRLASSGSDHAPGEYAAAAERAREQFRQGELFELVLGQTFQEPCERKASEIFAWLVENNPSPYGFLLNLGEDEHLVGASPEMYVRVSGRKVETCPISGTVTRGNDPMEDADRVLELLNTKKDSSELSMCTDVDRNDKSRICEPGSVRILGRRQIEVYSRLIHTVDHVEGTLRPEFDALDAFLTHAWAATVTGAPKPAALQSIENAEKSPRRWYGGAVGLLRFDGSMNTGLTLRTVRLSRGVAEVRAGATLLFDSDPLLEERETRIKASAFLDAVRGNCHLPVAADACSEVGKGRRILIVDHADSFVHTLANYFRQTGAHVVTVRRELFPVQLEQHSPDLVVLSPGPGVPAAFEMRETIRTALDQRLPIFGVCLGLQGIAEYFGARLARLDYPMHGKASEIAVLGGRLFKGLPPSFSAGRYHSLFVERDSLPDCLEITAHTAEGQIMALEHRTLPIAAVQFHPESLLTLQGNAGGKIVEQAVACLLSRRAQRSAAKSHATAQTVRELGY